ncbi:MAG: YfhO family protein [Planctomycetota bacterium]
MVSTTEEFGVHRALDRPERSPGALRAAERRSTTAWGLALFAVLAALLHDTLDGSHWLTQADALLEVEPWIQAAPEGFRASNPVLLDQTLVVHPWLVFARGELRDGRLPHWNPHNYLGQPLHAAYTGAFLWPLTWLQLAVGGWGAYAWIAWLKLAGAGLGMLLLLRRFGLAPAAAAVGATGFALCGFQIAWLGHPHTNVSLLLPWSLLAIEDAIARPGPPRAIPVAIAAALALVAGHVQTAVHLALFLALWLAFRTLRAPAGERRAGLSAWATLASGALGGLLLAAPAWLPFVEYVGHSRAATLFEEQEATAALDARQALPLMFDPDHWGDPRRGNYEGPLGDHLNFNELIGPYVGAGILVLALGGAITRRRDPRVVYLLLASLAALAVAWQLPPLWDALRDVPRLRSTKLMRFGLFAAFGFCVLAAYGLDHWRSRLETDRGRRALSIVSFLIVTLELLEFGRGYNPAALPEQVVPSTPTTDFLAAARAPWEQAGEAPPRAIGTRGTTLFPNANLFHGIAVPTGYDSIEDAPMAELVGLLTSDPRAELFVKEIGYFDRAVPLMSLLGVRWVLSHDVVPGLEAVHRSPTGLGVYENPQALPRLFLADRAELVAAADERLARLGAEDFEPRTALVEAAPVGVDLAAIAAGGDLEPSGWAPGRVGARVESEAPELLVLTETWDPGWRAAVDGEPVPVARVDHALCGVWLQPGSHAVEFRYAPRSWRVGLGLAFAGLLWLGATAAIAARRAR